MYRVMINTTITPKAVARPADSRLLEKSRHIWRRPPSGARHGSSPNCNHVALHQEPGEVAAFCRPNRVRVARAADGVRTVGDTHSVRARLKLELFGADYSDADVVHVVSVAG